MKKKSLERFEIKPQQRSNESSHLIRLFIAALSKKKNFVYDRVKINRNGFFK